MTAVIVGIYRAENAGHVERLLAPALAAGWSTAWWALDRVHDSQRAALGREVDPVELEAPAHPALPGERQHPVGPLGCDRDTRAALDEGREPGT